MQKKYGIISVVVLAAVLFLTPWMEGFFFKKNYEALLNSLNADNQSNIKVNVLEYKLGWLHSTVKLSVAPSLDLHGKLINTNLARYPAFSPIILNQTITHGPLIHDTQNNQWKWSYAFIQSDANFNSFERSILSNTTSNNDIYIETLVTFSNHYETQGVTPPFEIKTGLANTKIFWDGLHFTVSAEVKNNQLKNVKTEIEIGSIKSQGEELALNSDPIKLKYNMAKGSDQLWVGQHDLNIPAISFGDSSGLNLAIKKLDVLTQLANQKKLYSTFFKASLNQFVCPEITIENSMVSVSEKNLSSEGLSNLIQSYQSAKPNENNYLKFSSLIPKLLTPTTTLSEEIKMNTSFGKLLSTGIIYWPTDVKNLKTWDDVLFNTNFKIDLSISIALVDKIIEWTQKRSSSLTVDQQANVPPSEKGLFAKIDLMQKNKLIPLDVSFQIKDLVQSHLPAAVFSQNLHRYVITKDISESVAIELSAYYQTLYPPLPSSSSQPAMQPPASPPVISPADMAKQKLERWVNQGLIIKQGDDYITVITRERGNVQLNGHPYQ